MSEFDELETYGEEKKVEDKKSNTKKFFEGIKNVFVKPKTEEDKELDTELEVIKKEARIEAIKELKPQLKEQYKKEELEKLSKPKKSIFGTIGSELLGGGRALTNLTSDEKLNRMLGRPSGKNVKEDTSSTRMFDEEKILGSIGGNRNVKPTVSKVGPSNERILEMLGGKKKKNG